MVMIPSMVFQYRCSCISLLDPSRSPPIIFRKPVKMAFDLGEPDPKGAAEQSIIELISRAPSRRWPKERTRFARPIPASNRMGTMRSCNNVGPGMMTYRSSER